MDAAETSSLLRKTAKFLRAHLNLGCFEGPSGAHRNIVMRLSLAQDLLLVAFNVRLKENDGKAITELEAAIARDPQLKQEYQASLDDLIAWLFLNARSAVEEQAPSGLGNSSLQTPATSKVKKITDMMESYLRGLGSAGETACQVAFGSLVKVVKQLNSSLADAAQAASVGADTLMNLGRRTNEYFTLFVGCWLKSSSIASHFVFELGGFEFLLDTIGKLNESKAPEKETKAVLERDQIISGAQGEPDDEQPVEDSDLFDMLEPLPEADLLPKDAQKPPTAVAGAAPTEKEPERPLDEPPQLLLSELAGKQLVLIDENSGTGLASTHSKVDWSCNKRAYKNRLMVVPLTGGLRNEHWVLFQLSQTALLKEILIGFTNYWSTDGEAYARPLSVLVEAGLEKDNLTTVCSLELVEDDGFGSVQASVFGKSMQSFKTTTGEAGQTVESIIRSKLASLQNFQANFIKFSMRRHVLSCLENSPLAARQAKRPAFAINYISLVGYRLPESTATLSKRTQNYLASEQKKTALEVLSKICSGNFASVLRIIANEKQTIEKIKGQFDLLASLVTIKSSLIEPTFIAIARYNKEMGDWMIKKLLSSPSFEKHAPLTGNVVMCDRQEVPNRLQTLQEHLMAHFEKGPCGGDQVPALVPVLQVFMQSVRLSAPSLLSFQRIDLAVEP